LLKDADVVIHLKVFGVICTELMKALNFASDLKEKYPEKIQFEKQLDFKMMFPS
jgi:hypothetical protein